MERKKNEKGEKVPSDPREEGRETLRIPYSHLRPEEKGEGGGKGVTIPGPFRKGDGAPHLAFVQLPARGEEKAH